MSSLENQKDKDYQKNGSSIFLFQEPKYVESLLIFKKRKEREKSGFQHYCKRAF